jgi:hypothetical protein
MKVFDPSVVQQVLRNGIEKGYWNLQHLDTPPAAYQLQLRDARKSRFFGNDFYTDKPYVNLLRQSVQTVEVVTSDPGDLELAAATSTNAGPRNLDLLPQRWPDQPQVPDLGDRGDLSRDQDPSPAVADHGQTPHLGSAWEHDAPSARALRQPSLEPGEYLDDPAELDF